MHYFPVQQVDCTNKGIMNTISFVYDMFTLTWLLIGTDIDFTSMCYLSSLAPYTDNLDEPMLLHRGI